MRKRLLIPFALLFAVLVALNVLIHLTARTSQRHHLLTVLNHLAPATDCVFLGNSLVEAGCDPVAFKNAWPGSSPAIAPINLALGATTPVEHDLILKQALGQPLHLKYVIYGFFDDQLNAPVGGNWSDLVGNRAFSYYFPAEAAAFYAPGSRLKKWQLGITAHIPMLAERSSLWGKVEMLRRQFEEIGMPKHKINRFGRVDDFSALESKDVASFNERCGAIIRQRSGFSSPITDLIRLAR